MNNIELNQFAKRVHSANAKWWQDIDTGKPIKRNPKELLALVVSEICECLEGERKNLMDDKLPHRKMAEVEMADAYIRLLDFSAGFGLSFQTSERMNFDMPDNKGEALFLIVVNVCSTMEPSWLDAKIHIVSMELSVYHSLCMIESYCTKHGYDLFGAIEEKLKFNSTREDHTHEARRIAGGKQF
jgi:hypothetical protein